MASNSAGGEQSRSEYKQKHAFDFVLVFEIWSYAMSCPQPQKKYCISLLRQKKDVPSFECSIEEVCKTKRVGCNKISMWGGILWISVNNLLPRIISVFDTNAQFFQLCRIF